MSGFVVRACETSRSERAKATSHPTNRSHIPCASRPVWYDGVLCQTGSARPTDMPSIHDRFSLVSDFQLRGDQVRAVQELTEGLERGDPYQVLLGVTGSGKT